MELEYLSYSQVNTYLDCERAWYLGKIQKAEELQTWYLPTGSAVHQLIEDHLKGAPERGPQEIFYSLITKQMEIEPDLTTWLAGGSAQRPTTGDLALQQVIDCFEAAKVYLSSVVPDGPPEEDISGNLPGLEIPIRAFVDLVVLEDGVRTVVDYKTGKSKPKNNFQLETYAALYQVHGRPTPRGKFLMLNPAARKARPVDLSKIDPLEVGQKYQQIYDRMKTGAVPARKKFGCKWCFQSANCTTYVGRTERAEYFDVLQEGYFPF